MEGIDRNWILVYFLLVGNNCWYGFAEHIRLHRGVEWFMPNSAKRHLVPPSLQVNHSWKSKLDMVKFLGSQA